MKLLYLFEGKYSNICCRVCQSYLYLSGLLPLRGFKRKHSIKLKAESLNRMPQSRQNRLVSKPLHKIVLDNDFPPELQTRPVNIAGS